MTDQCYPNIDYRPLHRRHKWKERMMSLKRLRVEWATLTLADFTVSNVLCECRMDTPHYKLRHGDDLVCPISLGIQWARLRLNNIPVTDFKIEDNIEKAKVND